MKRRLMFVVGIILTVVLFAVNMAGCTGVKKLPDEVTLDSVLKDGGYEIVFEDNFDDDSIDETKWNTKYGGNTRRAGYYVNDEETIFEKNGTLTIRTAYREDGIYGSGWYTGWVETAKNRGQSAHAGKNYEGFNAKYGYFEARCKAPKGVGMWSAFWMMPDEGAGMTADDVMNSGKDGVEIDIMESPWMIDKFNKDQNIHVIHGDGYGNNIKSERSPSYEIPDMYDTFHTYGLLWTETEYVFYVDGRETYRTSYEYDGKVLGVSEVSEFLLLTVEIAGVEKDGVLYPGKDFGDNGKMVKHWAGNPDDNDKSLNYDFVIDYVKVYQSNK